MVFAALVVVVGVVLLTLSSAHSARDRAALTQTRALGDRVVIALHQYHADYGDYPRRLDHLVPRYLTEFPTPTWGRRRWDYYLDLKKDGTVNFRLQISGSRTGSGLRYYSVERRWYDSDS